MLVKDVLRELTLGSSVAEFDEKLDSYFVDTHTFHALISDQKDIVAGDKGTGKTALYRTLMKRYRTIDSLRGVEVLTGFNVGGSPIFQQLLNIPAQSEGQYIAFWKTYFLALIANWLTSQDNLSHLLSVKRLAAFIERYGLRTADNTPRGIFARIANMFSRRPRVASFQTEISLTEAGMPTFKPKLEFEEAGGMVQPPDFFGIDYNAGLTMLNTALNDSGRTIWVALDRLDEAFLGFPQVEVPALRALLRSYLDIQSLNRIKLKLFLRKDLFRIVIGERFVNLTHVNSRKIEIVWDEEDLLNLIVARIKESTSVVDALSLGGIRNDVAIYKIFPPKIAQGEKQSPTWNWMLSRIRDGNGITAPRNLIDFLEKARESQLRSEDRVARELAPEVSLLEPDSVRKGLKALSQMRVQDTLLAESATLVPLIEKFRDGKAEHNLSSLSSLLCVEESRVRATVKPLEEIGFLEEVGTSFKVPMLYREGLEITQGKAFNGLAEPIVGDTESS